MELLSAAFLLFLVIDPFGNVAIFISCLKHTPAHRKRFIIIRELLIALVVLVLFLFCGKYILSLLQVSHSSLGIAGAIVLLVIALKMVFQGSDDLFKHKEGVEPLIVPLAIPLIAGPSTMTLLTVFMARDPQQWSVWLLALLIAWAVSGVILIFAEQLLEKLGDSVLSAIERLIGLLLTTVAVEMFIREIKVVFGG